MPINESGVDPAVDPTGGARLEHFKPPRQRSTTQILGQYDFPFPGEGDP